MKTKLWQTEDAAVDGRSTAVARFTTGNDKRFDLKLAPFDVQGSMAHAEMLCAVGLLSEPEWKQLKEGLERVLRQIKDGSFVIGEEVEDVHSQIELMLTEEIGNAAKKLHTGRSRNDQVLLDIKLYLRHQLSDITARIKALFTLLQALSEKHKEVLLPGYTHFQVAMPSSFGLWFGAYAESLTDDLELIEAAYRICNRNPLGSGAGYGSPFPLDREMTTSLLNFDGLNYNVVYAQMTRGKSERSVATALSAVAATLSRLSYDACLYLSQNFSFISFPESLTTGSSIMPHKKNPDVFELVRARCNRIQSVPNELTLLLNNLPSGYHRDLQLTKEIIFPAVEDLAECLDMVTFMLEHVRVNDSILNDTKYSHLFTVEEVNKLVMSGVPFRDAYRQVAGDVESGRFVPDKAVNHSIAGGINNLCNAQIKDRFDKIAESISGAYTL